MLEELKNAKKAVGIKQSQRLVKSGGVKKAYIAKDASSHVAEPFVELCHSEGVEVQFVDTMEELGAACGIEVGAAVAVLF